ncbi:MAG: DUF748 domain-containing protein [Syntrophales bacterium]
MDWKSRLGDAVGAAKNLSRRDRAIIAGAAAFIFAASLAVIFVLPSFLKPLLVEKISAALNREAAFENIRLNPYTLSVTVTGFTLKEPNAERFLAFEEAYINFEGLQSLFRRALVVKELRLTRPRVNIIRRTDGTYNFSDLIPPPDEEKEDKKTEFFLSNLKIVDGGIGFDDRPMKTRHAVTELNFSIPFISTASHDADEYVAPSFSANINGRRYELAAKTKPFHDSRETSFDIDIQDADIPFYLNYIPVRMNCRLVSALLTARMNVRFVLSKGKAPSIRLAGRLALKKVEVEDLHKRKILSLPAADVEITSLDPLASDYHIAKVSIQSPQVLIDRDREAGINLLNLIAPPRSNDSRGNTGKSASSEKKPPLKARVDEVKVDAADITFTDSVPREPVKMRINPLSLRMTNLCAGGGEKGKDGNIDLSFIVDRKGEVSIKGPVDMDPLRMDLAVSVKDMPVGAFQPYFTDRMKIHVTRGAASTAGRFAVVQDEAGKPSLKYAGSIYISQLATVDKATSSRFINWKQLYFEKAEAGFNPLFLRINGISLTDFYARVLIHPDGSLNLHQIFAEEKKGGEKTDAAAAPAAEAGKARPSAADEKRDIRIGKVTLQGGRIDFMDRFIKPRYSARLFNISGSVQGMSSAEASRATVDLRGNLGRGSPVEITGAINPLRKDLYADIKMRFRDIDLSPVTPYASRYLGHPILKGKLTFDVAYLVEKRKLDARNNIMIDQLAFGDRVESPDAINAPVALAATLLTDRNGLINLDIPVSGDLDDPEFSVLPILWKVIVNLIGKAATAPFSLLASLAGGGEELSYIEFEYGSYSLSDAGREKINTLVRALRERPALRMDIEAYVDAERDREGLKRAAVNRKIREQKLKEITDRKDPAVPLEKVQVLPQESEKYLAMAYGAEKFPKPRNLIGLAKKVPASEMEKLMMAHVEVTDSDLRLLAVRRAERVKAAILKSGEIAPGRVFLVESGRPAPAKKENVRESRVDFRLK